MDINYFLNDFIAWIKSCSEIKLVEPYNKQDKVKGGIVNVPCVLVDIKPIERELLSKFNEQLEITIDLLVFSDYKKPISQLATESIAHQHIDSFLSQGFCGMELVNYSPTQKENGLLKSAIRLEKTIVRRIKKAVHI